MEDSKAMTALQVHLTAEAKQAVSQHIKCLLDNLQTNQIHVVMDGLSRAVCGLFVENSELPSFFRKDENTC